jgi:cobalt/nickel transport system ATP-binding protein
MGGQIMLFEIVRLTYRYESAIALDQLTLSIPEGSRIALLGANGSGKSTLLRLLDGLYFGESGEVRFQGEDLTERNFADDDFAFSFRRQVGLVFQNSDVQLFNPTVFDEVAFSPLQMRWSKQDVRERVMETLEWLRIAHLKNRDPHRLSGGEKKRVALASVLVMDPAVLLLDEPTAGLDPRSQSQLIDLLAQWGGSSKSVITATHDLGDLRETADRCYILDSGRLVAEGSPDEILGDSELLQRSNLTHVHRRRHSTGEVHSHPHLHAASR